MGAAEELRAEQAHLDRAYERLDELRSGAAGMAGDVIELGEGGTFGDRVDREVKLAVGLARRAALSIGDLPVCFGRIDLDTDEQFHIGRLGVTDRGGEVLVVDWRAPIAAAFYRATAGDPRGVRRRRHLRVRGRQVVSLDDEVLTAGGDDSELVGAGALLAAVNRARTGRMGDIVATVQAEQDGAIRAPLPGILVVQGGPGTGKTAVALHRAAYLLYEHRFPLESQGILVVGPNAVFLRYVEDVLPGLGETGVKLATPGELVPGVTTTRSDPPAVAAVKGGLSMLDTLGTVIAGHQRPITEARFIPFGIHRLELAPDATELAVEAGREDGRPHNAARAAVERHLLGVVWRRLHAARKRAIRAQVIGPDESPDQREVLRSLRRTPAFRQLLDDVWPVLTPASVVRQACAAAGVQIPEGAGWSEHDAALIDEARVLLGTEAKGRRTRRKGPERLDDALDRTLADMGLMPMCPACGRELTWSSGWWECEDVGCASKWTSERVLSPNAAQLVESVLQAAGHDWKGEATAATAPTTFGHVVIDEAQDLTPMQWRVLARRNPQGSMTVVGDLGQAKYPWAPARWEDVGPDVKVVELTVNYRTPEEVMVLAAEALREVDPSLTPPRSVRQAGEEPVTVEEPGDLLTRARAIAAAEVDVVRPGKVAIVMADELSEHPAIDVLDNDIAELGVEDAKGLEFDSVVVVDPDALSPAARYVALTRTTRRLTLVKPS